MLNNVKMLSEWFNHKTENNLKTVRIYKNWSTMFLNSSMIVYKRPIPPLNQTAEINQ